jgi:DNA-binding NarL/FixJ family response regulator
MSQISFTVDYALSNPGARYRRRGNLSFDLVSREILLLIPSCPAGESALRERRVTVLLVDDHEPFRNIISSLLASNLTLRVVAEASDGLDAVRKAWLLQPDLVLLDIGLPLLNGIEAARRIRCLAADSKIVFLTQETDPEVIQEARGLGASGYIVKSNAESELLATIELIFQDQDTQNIAMHSSSVFSTAHQDRTPNKEAEYHPAIALARRAAQKLRRNRNPGKRLVALLRRLVRPSHVRRPSRH